ncbi:hypothetical protein D9619_012033 [Psilocybe cf. subviscida]|uniref:Uncharacterized protein n=1 Tax=Psilocybe cf. subviscida TaxID=2480587 RepID=A0A8H5B6Z9_9AGAR|nr:hypothetical protein D9619_012033 [Psilocybe cf. subviscida]
MLPLPVSAPQGFALGCTQDFPTLHLDPADAVALTRSVTMAGQEEGQGEQETMAADEGRADLEAVGDDDKIEI